MAATHPTRVAGLVLLSSYLGESGPTARWLVRMGSRFLNLIPRDLRNAVLEVSHQAPQMARMRGALKRVRAPVHLIHGDHDDFAPIETAREFAKTIPGRRPARFQHVPGANHFLNDGPVDTLLDCLEACIPAARPAPTWRLPNWTRIAPAQRPAPLEAA